MCSKEIRAKFVVLFIVVLFGVLLVPESKNWHLVSFILLAFVCYVFLFSDGVLRSCFRWFKCEWWQVDKSATWDDVRRIIVADPIERNCEGNSGYYNRRYEVLEERGRVMWINYEK